MRRRKILPTAPGTQGASAHEQPVRPASTSLRSAPRLAEPRVASNSPAAVRQNKAGEISSFLAAIVESSDDAIYSCTLDGIITSWNRGAERTFGYTADEIIGQSTSRLSAPTSEEPPTLLDEIRQGLRLDHYETTRL